MTIGIIPTADAFLPTDTNTQIAVLAGTVSSLLLLDYVATPAVAVAGTAALLAAGWIHHRWETRATRHGYVLDEPYTFVDSDTVAKPEGNANWEVTAFLQARGVVAGDAIVTESRSDQYRIIKMPNFAPKSLEAQMPALGMMLGIKEEEMLFIPMFEAGMSAVLVHLPPEQWTAVPFDHQQLKPGELVGYLGRGIRGNPITYHVRHAMHILFAGKSGSGKTEAMCNDMESMRRSSTPVEVYIVDPKNTAQLKRQQATWYTQDIEAGIQKLGSLMAVCDARMNKYSQAGCDDFFEYREKVDANEPALFFYIDEVAEFLMEDLTEELDKGEYKRRVRAKHALQLSIQKQRASGLFMRLGMQHPEAKTLDTMIRNNITARVVCSVEDHHASGVAGVSGAEKLPMQGGVIFKYQNRTVLGRTAYLKAQTT